MPRYKTNMSRYAGMHGVRITERERKPGREEGKGQSRIEGDDVKIRLIRSGE